MKKLYKAGFLSIVITLMLVPTICQAFGSATHIYIADKVFNPIINKIDLYYGSTAPDIALQAANNPLWPDAFEDTHYTYKDLRSYAQSRIQRAFANGWITHNELWGADYYAHIKPFEGSPYNYAYVIQKAYDLLPFIPALAPDEQRLAFAHFAIEVAIDLLLKNDDPFLGSKLLFANLFRSWQDRNLLANVLVWQEHKTNWLTLAMSELALRNLVHQYALAFALPGQQAKDALAQLGVQLASDIYGIVGIDPSQLLDILNEAIDLCSDDYQDVIDEARIGIQGHL